MESTLDIAWARLRNQRLIGTRCATPESAVSWMGAVQAQEYVEAQWGLALRTRRSTRDAIEQAATDGSILRTHVLRPTWHFVAPADIRWMLSLTGPCVSKRMAPYNRQLELDARAFRKSETVIARALRGGTSLTRQELRTALERGGIDVASGQRLAHLVMQAELDGVICSGPRRGKQFTYMLLDGRVPSSPTRSRDDSLAELARRYFTSHGPAQLRDFAWWSGLPVGDARAGLAMSEPHLIRHEAAGATYWAASVTGARRHASPQAWLLPMYDEYLIAYKDRSAAFDRRRLTRTWPDSFSAAVVVDGLVVGAWRRTFPRNRLTVTVTALVRLTGREASAIEDAAHAYAGFIDAGLELAFSV